MWAAIKTNADAVQVLLDNGADPNLQDEDGLTALMVTLSPDTWGFAENVKPDAKRMAIIKALLDKGADANAKNRIGSTALMGAVSCCHPDVVQVLLERGADV